jgi:dimethylaniline monooxygenase (N-oxide forming)
VKELLDEGHTVTCYEQHDNWGGVFYYNPIKGGVYDNTVLTISNYFMAFSDFPPPKDEPYVFWHHSQYWKYINDYAAHFKLAQKANFQFNSTVKNVTQLHTKKWRVTTLQNGKDKIEEFDAVAVCSGAHQVPLLPDWPGAKYNTKGVNNKDVHICHAETYKLAKGDPRFDGKKVVCVGAGETGVDVGYEVSLVAKQAYIAMRRTPMVIPRFAWNIDKLPSDAHTTRAMLYPNHPYIHGLHIFDQALKTATGGEIGQKIFKGVGGLGCPRMAKIADLANRSTGGVTDQFLTKNCNFIDSLLNKKLLEKPGIQKIDGKTVFFTDGSKVEDVDTILLSTGYKTSFPFVDLPMDENQNIRGCYKHMFHPKGGDSFAFVGFARPTSGGVPATAEIQSRYFALVLSGSRKLPDDWLKRIPVEAEMENKQFHLSNLKTLIFWGEYMETMATHIQCNPDLWTYFFTDPLRWFRLMYGAMICAQYRLRGPHAKPEIAKKTIDSLPLKTPPPFMVMQSLSAVLSWLGGALANYRPPSW